MVPPRPLTVLAAVLVAACAATPSPSSLVTTPSPAPATVVAEYLPGLEATLRFPAAAGRAPLVVMVPGGGWRTADPGGLAGLAEYLAAAGITAATVEIRAADDGVAYPVPVEDVRCAVASAAAEARRRGVEPGPVVLLGHSSGAHLASLAALAPGAYPVACPEPAVVADALIGLAGIYDVAAAGEAVAPLFAPGTGAAIRRHADPTARAGERPELPVLLLHGDADPVVPVSFTTDFGRVLAAARHPVETIVVSGADHHSIYTAGVTGGAIAAWVRGLR